MEKSKILVVEDEAIIAKDLQLRLQGLGYDVPYIVATGEDAIDKAKEICPDLVLMDIMLLGRIDGIEAARQIRLNSDIPIIYLSAYSDNMLHDRAKATEPFGYLSKPIANHDLHNTIEMALYKNVAEKKLRKEIKFTEKAIDAQMDTFFVFDINTGKAIRWNKRFREVSGYTDEEIASLKAPDSYYSQEDLEKAAAVIETVISKGQGTVEISLICKDGKRVPTEYLASAIRDENSNIKYIISVGRDITDRMHAEEKISRSEYELSSIYDAITDFMTVISTDYKIARVNRVVEEHFGIDLVGKVCYEVYQGRNEICPDCPTKKAIETKKPAFSFQPATMVSPPFDIYAFPILNKGGDVVAVVEHGKDVTERKRIEDELETKVSELEKYYELAINREIKMIELKKEITQLKSKLAKQ